MAIAAALWSSKQFCALPMGAVFLGEIGLTGEIRNAVFVEDRLKEAAKLGFTTAFLPASSQRQLKDSKILKDLKVHWLKDVKDLSRALGGGQTTTNYISQKPSARQPQNEKPQSKTQTHSQNEWADPDFS